MYTVCPQCTLALAVTAADLRAGQGYVRCGRCANVFNALLALQDETDTSPGLPIGPVIAITAPVSSPEAEPVPPAAREPAREPAATPEEPADAAPAPALAVEAVLELMPEALPEPMSALEEGEIAFTEILPEDLAPLPREQPRQVAEAREAANATDATDATLVIEYRGTGTYETIVLEGEGYLQTEELLPDEEIDAGIAAVSRQLAAAHGPIAAHAGDPGAGVFELAGNGRAAPNKVEEAAMSAAIAAAVAQLGPAQALPRRPRWLGVAAAALALLLSGQLLHHWRNQLATRPGLTVPLTRLYAALGQPLTPEWDLSAYDVRQLGASADGADNRAIHVRLSLASRARLPQGLPLVRLTLIDRYGKALSAGELEPAQYLPPAQQGLRMLAPDQRIDTDVSVLDASQQASSFELDVCLPRPGGGLRCAADNALAGSHT